MAEELNLTAEQKTKMQEINKGRREAMAPKRKAMKEAREALEKSLK
ncbi:MAG: Spy protein, partial [Moraxellaceae bacterium]